MNTKITAALCTNESLFELSGAVAQKLRPALYNFLKSKEYPWQLLGGTLAAFIDQQVCSVAPQERHKGTVSPQAFLENSEQIVIEEGAIIEAGAYIAGPAYIEAGATVRHGAYVRGCVYVSSGAVVGHTTEVKGSLLLPAAKAAHFAYVGDTILGIDCNLGAGTKCANLRLDHGVVPVHVGESKVSSGLKKFGAIVGNRAQTGCNAVTNPGTILLPGAILLPNATGQGIILPRRAFKQHSP